MNQVPSSVLVIAEVGVMHDGSFGNALRLIDAAADCGADVIKFQTHISAAEMVEGAPAPAHFQGEPRFQYFERTAFTEEQWRELKGHAESRGLIFLSSVFSVAAVDLLERIGVERHKVPSGEVTNLPLLEAMARTGKPVLLSSGMSSWEELDRAVETLQAHGSPVVLLQCTSEYPCAYEHVGLNVMLEMSERYGLPVGLSDHTVTNYAAFAAVALGAVAVEKHFAFSRLVYGGDAKQSLEPDELAELVRGVRAIETMRDTRVDKDDLTPFRPLKEVYEKSIVAAVDIPADSVITEDMVAAKRPGTGLPTRLLSEVVGRRAARTLAKDTVLSADDVVGLDGSAG